MAITISDVKFDPEPLVAGKDVKATCKVSADAGVKSVTVYDPRGWAIKMYDDGTHGDEKAGDGVYTLTEHVPYDADSGTYSSTLVVKDNDDNVERKSVSIQIK